MPPTSGRRCRRATAPQRRTAPRRPPRSASWSRAATLYRGGARVCKSRASSAARETGEVAAAVRDVSEEEDERQREGREGRRHGDREGERAAPPPGDQRHRQARAEGTRRDADPEEPDRLEQTPEREVPCQSMPQTAEDHRDRKGDG